VANHVYPKTKAKLAKAQLDLRSVTVKALLVETNYVYADAHEFLSDAPSAYRVATSPALTGKGVGSEDASFHSDSPVFSAVTGSSSGEHVSSIILFRDTGVAATSELIAYIDTGVAGLPFVPRGADEQIVVSSRGWFALSSVSNPANVLVETEWANTPVFNPIAVRPRLSIIPQIDGRGNSGGRNFHTTTTGSAVLTTSFPGDAIVLFLAAEGANTITNISSPNTHGWTHEKLFTFGGESMDIWYGFATNPLSAEVITVTVNPGVDNGSIIVFGVHDAIGGAYSTSPFRTDSSGEATAFYQNFTTFAQTTPQVTGVNADVNDVLLVFYGSTQFACSAVGAGDTMIDTNTEQGGVHRIFSGVEYRALHSALSGSTEGFGFTSFDWGVIAMSLKGSRDGSSDTGDGWSAWTGASSKAVPPINNISGTPTVNLAKAFKALLDDYLAGSFSGWASWPIDAYQKGGVNTEGSPANILLTNELGALIAVLGLGAIGSGWTACTGVADRSSHNTATATNTDIARAMKALIDDLLAAGVLTS
jgi:hypothetical protein